MEKRYFGGMARHLHSNLRGRTAGMPKKHASKGPAKQVHSATRKEDTYVNYHVLSVAALLSIILLFLLFNIFLPEGQDLSLPSSEARGQAQELQNAISTLQVPRATSGIYLCANPEYEDCAAFCGQVSLKPTRCMVKVEQKAFDSSVCACS